MASSIRAAVTSADPRLAVSNLSTLEALSEQRLTINRIVTEVTGAFGLLAVAVACLGLFGTLSYAVSRRTQEIGVRLALGAGPWTVCRAILREALGLVAIGCGAGIGLALVGRSAIASLLYGLSPRDPATFAMATALLTGVALIAAFVPAWRASRIDPLRALRVE
jgi:ABC-type antimicrobial peptide transport system permease subunit